MEVLLVDDEPETLEALTLLLEHAGHRVTTATEAVEALAIAGEEPFDVVITDLVMPGVAGLELLRALRDKAASADLLLMSAYADALQATSALKEGAVDYVQKPIDFDALAERLERLGRHRELRRVLLRAREDLARGDQVLVGRSPEMARLRVRVETIAQACAPVLITGETGTGKELVARAIHAQSARQHGPFVAVNCAGLPDALLESELFGHTRGAFTGAVRQRDGRFVAAHGGTLLLDEIAEMPVQAQAKLLRVLEQGVLEPVGADRSVSVDVRVLAATNRDLRACIAAGRFRQDLYYRLNVLAVELPPLRHRQGDLPLLVQHFLSRHVAPDGTLPEVAPETWAALLAHSFPGNVRELQHAVEHAVVLARGGPIGPDHLPADVARLPGVAAEALGGLEPLADALEAFERAYIQRALGLARGRRDRAADILGISRKNLWEKMRRHGIGRVLD